MKCVICGGVMQPLFEHQLLGHHNVRYERCPECGYICTESPYWLEEAYNSAIARSDIGLLSRNLRFRDLVPRVIDRSFDIHGRFLDYGGGYGIFVRMMRDMGYDFYRYDKYCTNMFAEGFDGELPDRTKGALYELLTAFEVMEHLVDPVAEMEQMLGLSDSVLFSTELVPEKLDADWWYFAFDSGQHISFHTEDSLRRLAARFGAKLYTNGTTLHLISRRQFDKPLRIGRPFRERLARLFYRHEKPNLALRSKLGDDYAQMLAILKKQ